MFILIGIGVFIATLLAIRFVGIPSRNGKKTLTKSSREVLKKDWKPISNTRIELVQDHGAMKYADLIDQIEEYPEDDGLPYLRGIDTLHLPGRDNYQNYPIVGMYYHALPQDTGIHNGYAKRILDNPHDLFAVGIFNKEGILLAYIPREENKKLWERLNQMEGGIAHAYYMIRLLHWDYQTYEGSCWIKIE